MDENISQQPPQINQEQPPQPECQPPQPEYQPPAQPEYQQQILVPVKQRRVGTFTLGIALIFIGVLVPATMIFKDRALDVIRFAPAILIIMGIEVLYFAIRHKDTKLKYDGLSIFLVLMMTVISVGVSSIAPIVSDYIKYERTVSVEAEKIKEELDDVGNSLDIAIDSAYAHPRTYWGNYAFSYEAVNEDLRNLKMVAYVNLDVKKNADGKIPTNEELEEKLAAFLKKITYPIYEISGNISCEEVTVAAFDLNENEIKNSKVKLHNVEELTGIEQSEEATDKFEVVIR